MIRGSLIISRLTEWESVDLRSTVSCARSRDRLPATIGRLNASSRLRCVLETYLRGMRV